MNPLTGDEPRRPRPARGPLGRLIDLFSGIPLGVSLLITLFVYSSIGSAGLWYPVNARIWSLSEGWAQLHVRQLRGFEMTEFEWFHWWPFDLILGLICLNVVTATLRRIPFKPLNYGVWTIHVGILTLCAGCVWYFGTKLEGDAPVVRRQVRIEIANGEVGYLTAVPGNALQLGSLADRWSFRVSSINREWPLLSEEHKGEKEFQVNVAATGPDGLFIRSLHAHYPQYDEDLIRSGDPAQPFARAVKVTGEKIVDPSVKMDLVYEPQEWMYLAHNIEKSWALYLREQGQREWVQRPVEGLPLYQDYIASPADVYVEGALPPPPSPLDVIVNPVEADDPLPGVPLRIRSYLRYARMRTRWVAGGDRLNPVASVVLESEGFPEERFELVAADERRAFSDNELLQLRWAGSTEERDALGNVDNVLHVEVPSIGFSDDLLITPEVTARGNPELEFTEIEGTPYSYRIDTLQNGLEIGERHVSVAFVDIRTGTGDTATMVQRWVFDDPGLTRDVDAHAEEQHAEDQDTPRTGVLEDGIVMSYRPSAPVQAPVTLVAGPGQSEMHVLVYRRDDEPLWSPVTIGEPVDLSGQGQLLLTVDALIPRARAEQRPEVVPLTQRERDAQVQLSMVQVELSAGGAPVTAWVPYHHYPLRDANETLRRFPYSPKLVELPDGRRVEMILSRQRVALPEAVALDDFEIVSHVGGFNDTVSSIRDWVSQISFTTDGESWTEPMPVQMNKPAEHAGLWYFQAQWDPPSAPRFQGDVPSQGLNYTVLGIANRNGVTVMLLGAAIAVLGMIYAFYFKPVVRRRIQQRALMAAGVTTAKDAA